MKLELFWNQHKFKLYYCYCPASCPLWNGTTKYALQCVKP